MKIIRHILKEEDGFEWNDEIGDMLTGDIDMVFLQNPVNPTGRCIDRELTDKLIKKAGSLNTTVVYDLSFYTLCDACDEGGGI